MPDPQAAESNEQDRGNSGSSASVAHRIPGRIRLHIPDIRERPELVEPIRAGLANLPNVNGCSVRPRSGSLVVYYDPDAEPAVLKALQTMIPGLSVPGKSRQRSKRNRPRRPIKSSDIASAIPRALSEINEKVDKATGGMDLKILVPVTLLTLSILGAIAGAIRNKKLPAPSWYDLLWFAFNTFVILNLTLTRPIEPEDHRRAGDVAGEEESI